MWRATDDQPIVLPKIAYGRGSRLYDVTGKEYIDGSGGPAVYCLGHAHPEVNDAIKRQLDAVAHAYRYNFASDPMEQLTELVARRSGPGFTDMIFTTGGSEAVESALKVALHYHHAAGAPTRRRFIARERSWHGNTLGALSVSHFEERRAPYEEALVPASHISAVNPPPTSPPRAPTSSNARSSGSATRTSPPSSSSRWSVRRVERYPPHPVTRAWCARSATAMAC